MANHRVVLDTNVLISAIEVYITCRSRERLLYFGD